MSDNVTKIYGKARFQFRRDTAENWAAENPILLAGEHGVVTDSKLPYEREKIGDGITPWNELGWWHGPQGIQGEKGEKGDQGPQGEKGDIGEAVEECKKYADTTFAPAIKNSVSGSAIAVHDVSPIEHNLAVKLSGNTFIDLSEVSVSRYGKNLVNIGTAEFTYWYLYTLEKPLPAGTYTFSALVTSTDTDAAWCAVQIRTSSYTTTVSATRDTRISKTFTITDELYAIALFASSNASTAQGDTAVFADCQLELGSTATDYEPYIEPQTVQANADGTVDGLTSLSPDMTLTTDTEGAVIDLTYRADTKMYIDNKFAELQALVLEG